MSWSQEWAWFLESKESQDITRHHKRLRKTSEDCERIRSQNWRQQKRGYIVMSLWLLGRICSCLQAKPKRSEGMRRPCKTRFFGFLCYTLILYRYFTQFCHFVAEMQFVSMFIPCLFLVLAFWAEPTGLVKARIRQRIRRCGRARVAGPE